MDYNLSWADWSELLINSLPLDGFLLLGVLCIVHTSQIKPWSSGPSEAHWEDFPCGCHLTDCSTVSSSSSSSRDFLRQRALGSQTTVSYCNLCHTGSCWRLDCEFWGIETTSGSSSPWGAGVGVKGVLLSSVGPVTVSSCVDEISSVQLRTDGEDSSTLLWVPPSDSVTTPPLVLQGQNIRVLHQKPREVILQHCREQLVESWHRQWRLFHCHSLCSHHPVHVLQVLHLAGPPCECLVSDLLCPHYLKKYHPAQDCPSSVSSSCSFKQLHPHCWGHCLTLPEPRWPLNFGRGQRQGSVRSDNPTAPWSPSATGTGKHNTQETKFSHMKHKTKLTSLFIYYYLL